MSMCSAVFLIPDPKSHTPLFPALPGKQLTRVLLPVVCPITKACEWLNLAMLPLIRLSDAHSRGLSARPTTAAGSGADAVRRMASHPQSRSQPQHTIVETQRSSTRDVPAAWRLHMHAARRRVALVVMAAVKFKRALGCPDRLAATLITVAYRSYVHQLLIRPS